jgi:hypothetical protein
MFYRAELVESESVKRVYGLLLDDTPGVRQSAAELVNTVLELQAHAKAEQHGV